MANPAGAGYHRLQGEREEKEDVQDDSSSAESTPVAEKLDETTHLHSHASQMVVAALIGLNVLALWGEIDHPQSAEFWVMVNTFFAVAFSAEIALRIVDQGLEPYCRGSHYILHSMDVVITAIGFCELFFTVLFGSRLPKWIRILRLSRLFRLLRVLRMFKKLYDFSVALQTMLYEFIWIFTVMFVMILCCGIPLTHLLGRGWAFVGTESWSEEEQLALDNVKVKFQDVSSSLFTLFQLTTVDNWDEIANPLILMNSAWRCFFVLYIAVVSWAMIAVLTAVGSDKMIDATSDRKSLQEQVQQQKEQKFIRFLEQAFKDADADGNNYLDKEEFETMMKQDFVHKQMKHLGIRLSQEELLKTWEMLDIDDSGELTIQEFVEGLRFLQQGLATKHIVTVDYSLKRVGRRFFYHMDYLQDDLEVLREQNREIEALLERHESLAEETWSDMFLWQRWAERSRFAEVAEGLPAMNVYKQFASAGPSSFASEVWNDTNLQTIHSPPHSSRMPESIASEGL
mmetsp:Transcript_25165/g.57842  ORF Transcript_25165/g.57842 Transcript_25165/m.57842 type:complete len:513 (-) Transcript_25165:50-1588(-)